MRVVNHGSSARTFTKSLDLRTNIPGVELSFPGNDQVNVSAGGSATFRVRLTANASQMQNTRDATVAGSQVGFPRHWFSEEGGLIILTPEGGGSHFGCRSTQPHALRQRWGHPGTPSRSGAATRRPRRSTCRDRTSRPAQSLSAWCPRCRRSSFRPTARERRSRLVCPSSLEMPTSVTSVQDSTLPRTRCSSVSARGASGRCPRRT